jgi:hypothetical protein
MAVTNPANMDVEIYVTNAVSGKRIKSSYKLKEENKE